MSNIELVIKISEKLYENIQSKSTEIQAEGYTVENAILNGTLLPKGHGALKDADKLKDAFITWSMAVQGYFTDADIASIVYHSPTIIEADKAESEE